MKNKVSSELSKIAKEWDTEVYIVYQGDNVRYFGDNKTEAYNIVKKLPKDGMPSKRGHWYKAVELEY